MDTPVVIETLQGVAQIAFYAIVGTIAILTYRRAKHTILQPLRAEAFKEQIAELKKSLSAVGGEDEYHIRKFYDIDGVVRANCFLVLDTFAKQFFDIDVDSDTRPYARGRCPTSIVSASNLQPCRMGDDETNSDADSQEPDLKWPEHVSGVVCITRECSSACKQLDAFLHSPLIPEHLISTLRKHDQAVEQSLHSIKKANEAVARQLEGSCKSADDLRRMEMPALYNIYNDHLPRLETTADRYRTAVRDYLRSDNLYEIR